jgi:hypothetical protein
MWRMMQLEAPEDFVIATDTNGNPLQGGDDQEAWAVYNFTVVREGQKPWARSAFCSAMSSSRGRPSFA